jgi:diacylglycerol kinase family enzyme
MTRKIERRKTPAAMSKRRWVGIAANANSGLGSGQRRVQELVQELGHRGFEVRAAWTPAERSNLVRESDRDPHCHCLVAAGGDGTVAALVNERPSVPITVLPTGTENLFASHFQLDKRPVRLADIIKANWATRIDLGLNGEQRFALMAGLGFDADVVTRHHLNRVGRSGVARPTHRGAYVESVLRSSLSYRFPPMTVRITDPGHEETLTGTSVFLFNLPRYALGLPFAPTAQGNDGWLDLVVFQKAGSLQALHYLWLVVRGLHLNTPGVEHRRVRRVAVESAEPVPVQLDGDPGGYVEAAESGRRWSVEILPRAIDVIVPRASA